MLKYFQQKGGTVIFSSGTCNTEDSAIIQSKKQRLKKFLIDIDTPTHFAMVFYGGKSIFRMTELENKLLIEPLSKSAIALSKAQSISQLTNCILFDKDKVEEVYLSANLSAATLKILSKAITETLPCSFENANLDDMYEICLEKYDIAKQTGITYPGFKKLFHKYGKGIDEMTELAYDFMNKVRDPRQIWDLAENMYQKKYEWKN